MTRWLITGGCGFIGTSLINYLQKLGGHSFRILDNLSVGTREDLSGVVNHNEIEAERAIPEPQENIAQLIVGDICDQQVTQILCKDVDVIVHLAANTGVPASVADPRLDMESNVIGVFNLLEAARANEIKRFIFASSGAPAGVVTPPIHEEMAPHPASPYGASKLAGEGYCSAYFHAFGINTIALRFGNVYGPGSKHKSSVVAKFIKQALSGETCEIYGTGNQTRDFIYIDDLTDAILKASEFDGGGEVFQIASNKECTVNELVELLRIKLHEVSALDMKVEYGEQRVGDVIRNYSDTTKARKLLGWQPKYDLEQGIQQTISYFAS